MSKSATEPASEREWLDSLGAADLPEQGSEATDTATADAGSQPGEAEGDGQAPPEGDAAALEEGAAEESGEVDAKVAAADAGKQPAEEPKAEPAQDAPTATDGQAPEQPSEVVWEDFSFRADKTEVKLTGAKASADEIRMPRVTFQKELQPYLADRSVWERDRQKLEAQLREVRESRSAAEVEAEQVLKFYKELLEKPREEAWEFFENLSQNKEVLLAKAEAAALRHRAERAESFTNEQKQAEQQEELQRVATDMLGRAVDLVLGDDEFKELGMDRGQFYDRLASLGAQNLFFYPDEAFVRDNPGWHVRPGELAIDWRVIAREAGQEARVYRERAEAARKIAEAQRTNESKKRDAKKAVPPTVRAGGTPLPGAQEKEPSSESEWRESVGLR